MVLIETHGWKGIGRDRDLFHLHLRLGWFSIAADRESVIGVLRDLKRAVAAVKGGAR